MNEIKYIKAELISPHPDNPRKDLGDLSELIESIKTNGILQNLTVIPRTDGEEGYLTIIGHRRYAAGMAAGVTEYPCQIKEGLTLREQVGIMLEENMQRNDLTIIEQAQGFQMMIDLGETVDTIAERTGFAKSTVYHRLNIAKLDQELLKTKQDNPNFQLSITDLQALEQIKDVNVRNEVLRKATNSRELVWSAQNKAEAIEREEKKRLIIEFLERLGLKKAPKSYEHAPYNDEEWKVEKRINLDDDLLENEMQGYEGFYYHYDMYSKRFEIIKRDTEWKKEKEIEKQRKDRQEAIRVKTHEQIEAIRDEMDMQRKTFVRDVISGKIKPLKETETAEVIDSLWEVIANSNRGALIEPMIKFVANTEKSYYWQLTAEEKKEAIEKLKEMSTLHQMLIAACIVTSKSTIAAYNNQYNEEVGHCLKVFTGAIAKYGFTYETDEQYEIMLGQHKLYTSRK